MNGKINLKNILIPVMAAVILLAAYIFYESSWAVKYKIRNPKTLAECIAAQKGDMGIVGDYCEFNGSTFKAY